MGRVKGSKQVSEETKRCILDAYYMGVRQKDIVQYYQMPQSTVANIIRRGRNTEKRGRKQKLSDRSIRNLLSCARKNRFCSIHTITAKFNEFSTIKVCVNTVRSILHKNGMKNYVAASKPFLSKLNIKRRRKWAQEHQYWDAIQWDKVVFSDESSFTVRPKHVRKKVWRQKGRRFDTQNTVSTFKSGYVSISVWAGFSGLGRTPLVRIEGTLRQEKYKEILEKQVLPFASKHYGGSNNFTFQQDNFGPHKAKSIKAYLDENEVKTMDWPAQSPDLNPIENAWAILKRRLRKRARYPKNADELFSILQQEWSSIPNSYFKKLVSSMHTRVQLVKLNKGRSTKY